MESAPRFDLLFVTDRFNLSEPREYFINDCCFGDDAAQWLVERLRAKGLTATEPDQEDWGWYFDVRMEGQAYFVGVGGTAEDESAPGAAPPAGRAANRGQWRLMVERHRSLWQKLTGANRLTPDDPLLRLLEAIVTAEPEVTWIGIE